ncbi:MAG: acylphosphatase [Gammaproteobacteria bacterium]|nr:acylphosphatase [Gammaproteobacteria bacterium]
MQTLKLKGIVAGRVQGVGFRYFVLSHAQRENISGYVRNLADGRVEFLLSGESVAITRVLEKIRIGPGHARVDDLQVEETDLDTPGAAFIIR